jgi:hypothetical protein
MSYDRNLADKVKVHFAGKSSEVLREIEQSTDMDRWSFEAKVAAAEVLEDRLAGRAQEPETPEEEPPQLPRAPVDEYSLASFGSLLLAGLGAPVFIVPTYRIDYAALPPDTPVSFGFKTAWLALETTDTEAVAAAIGLRNARAARWAEGIMAAYESAIYITPPVADWTLAVGTTLFPPGRTETFVQPLLERLSRQFGDAQYFCTHRAAELHVWARAKGARLVRGYGWLGDKGLTLWDEGEPTEQERDLGLVFVEGRSEEGKNPDESSVMQLAYLWSVDPTDIDEQHKEPVTGILGEPVVPT